MNLLRRPRRHARGQALVELAVILPILALLLVMALDFGRVFFGWVALHNAARIGADYAAGHADAWRGTPDATEQEQLAAYERLVLNDLQALNCALPSPDPVPDPSFTDLNGDGDSYGDGDHTQLTLDCEFGLLTPLAESLLGGPVALSAGAQFAIYRTIIADTPAGAAPTPAPFCEETEALVPDMVGQTMQNAANSWVAAGFSESNFSPAVTNPNKNKAVLTQSLAAGECHDAGASVTVTHS